MAKIKYLGTAHIRELLKGENWNGRLADPLEKDVRWSIDNHFLVDSEEAGLSDEAVELLLEDNEFKNVDGMRRIPVSAAENLWHGVRDKSYDATDPRVDADGSFHSTLVDGEQAEGTDGAAKTGESASSGTPTTTGGSTTGSAGAGSRGGRSGSRSGGPGGSTTGD